MTTTHETQRAKIMEDIQLVIQDTQALLRMTAHEAGDEAAAVRARVQERLAHATAEIKALQESALQSTKEAAQATEQFVHEHPWKSVGIAAIAGLALGLLISRR